MLGILCSEFNKIQVEVSLILQVISQWFKLILLSHDRLCCREVLRVSVSLRHTSCVPQEFMDTLHWKWSVWITDSVPHEREISKHPPFRLLSLGDIIADVLFGYELRRIDGTVTLKPDVIYWSCKGQLRGYIVINEVSLQLYLHVFHFALSKNQVETIVSVCM